jgi:hypothetical protein
LPSCALKVQCTTGKERRTSRWEHEAVLEAEQSRLDRNPDKMRERRRARRSRGRRDCPPGPSNRSASRSTSAMKMSATEKVPASHYERGLVQVALRASRSAKTGARAPRFSARSRCLDSQEGGRAGEGVGRVKLPQARTSALVAMPSRLKPTARAIFPKSRRAKNSANAFAPESTSSTTVSPILMPSLLAGGRQA